MAERRPTADARAAALRAAGLLDTPPEEAFDRLTRLAHRVTGAPVALVSLVDGEADRQFFKSGLGLGEPWASRRQVPLSHSFCRHVVEDDAPLAVEDAGAHPRVGGNPAIRELGVAAYLGVPFRDPDGTALGALCAIDRRARAWRGEEIAALQDLARIATTELASRRGAAALALGEADARERRRVERELERSRRSLEAVIATVVDGLVVIDAGGTVRTFNPAAERIFGYAAAEVVGRNVSALMTDSHRAAHDGYLARFLATGERRIIGIGRTVEGRRKDGSAFPLELAVGEMAAEPRLFVGILRDVTERQRMERELARRALHDPLTELPNRALFHRELAAARARVEAEGGGRRLGVLLIDLDGFKAVNDTFGHEAGDRVLVEVGARLRASVRVGDVAARLGGDEFAVVAQSTDAAELEALARRLVLRLSAPVGVAGRRLRVGGSVGLAVFPDDPGSPDELLAHADRALYAAKAAGRGTWRRHGAASVAPRGNGVGETFAVAAVLRRA